MTYGGPWHPRLWLDQRLLPSMDKTWDAHQRIVYRGSVYCLLRHPQATAKDDEEYTDCAHQDLCIAYDSPHKREWRYGTLAGSLWSFVDAQDLDLRWLKDIFAPCALLAYRLIVRVDSSGSIKWLEPIVGSAMVDLCCKCSIVVVICACHPPHGVHRLDVKCFFGQFLSIPGRNCTSQQAFARFCDRLATSSTRVRFTVSSRTYRRASTSASIPFQVCSRAQLLSCNNPPRANVLHYLCEQVYMCENSFYEDFEDPPHALSELVRISEKHPIDVVAFEYDWSEVLRPQLVDICLVLLPLRVSVYVVLEIANLAIQGLVMVLPHRKMATIQKVENFLTKRKTF